MKISDKESKILHVLWKEGEMELGAIVEALHASTKWTRNTVHTYLTRMEAKGIVGINKDVYPHLYYALLDQKTYQEKESKSFLERVYQGSASDLIVAFLKEETITSDEKEKLKKLLDEMDV